MTPTDPRLPDMLRAQARGHLPTEAAEELLVGHGGCLDLLAEAGLVDVFPAPGRLRTDGSD